MIYWHVMTVVLVLGADGEIAVAIPFRTADSCGDALPAIVSAMRVDHPGSYAICTETDLPSGVNIRPRARGE